MSASSLFIQQTKLIRYFSLYASYDCKIIWSTGRTKIATPISVNITLLSCLNFIWGDSKMDREQHTSTNSFERVPAPCIQYRASGYYSHSHSNIYTYNQYLKLASLFPNWNISLTTGKWIIQQPGMADWRLVLVKSTKYF